MKKIPHLHILAAFALVAVGGLLLFFYYNVSNVPMNTGKAVEKDRYWSDAYGRPFVGASGWELKEIPLLDRDLPTLAQLDGRDIDIDDLIANSETVLIHFWATWCAPCLDEVPELFAAFEDAASRVSDNQQLPKLLFVAVGDSASAVRNGLPNLFQHLSDPAWLKQHNVVLLLDPQYTLFRMTLAGDTNSVNSTVPSSYLYDPTTGQNLVHVGPFDWHQSFPVLNF